MDNIYNWINNNIDGLIGGRVDNLRHPGHKEEGYRSVENLHFFHLLREGTTGGGGNHELASIFENMQKLTFKLKEEKSLHYDKYGDSTKNIQLHFCDIHN